MTLKEVLDRAVTSRCADLCILTLVPCPDCQQRIDEVWRVIGPIERQIIQLRNLTRQLRREHERDLASGRLSLIPALTLYDLENVLLDQAATTEQDDT